MINRILAKVEEYRKFAMITIYTHWLVLSQEISIHLLQIHMTVRLVLHFHNPDYTYQDLEYDAQDVLWPNPVIASLGAAAADMTVTNNQVVYAYVKSIWPQIKRNIRVHCYLY